jgi:hypothetical protein
VTVFNIYFKKYSLRPVDVLVWLKYQTTAACVQVMLKFLGYSSGYRVIMLRDVAHSLHLGDLYYRIIRCHGTRISAGYTPSNCYVTVMHLKQTNEYGVTQLNYSYTDQFWKNRR